ncbi:MAG TPA: hypothetical protein VN018_08155 [Brevundimonas sp.]|nr:hypothetical protein [Brevundimonas sp.]
MMITRRPLLGRWTLAAIYTAGVAPLFMPMLWFVSAHAYYLLLAAFILWGGTAGFAIWASTRRWALALTLGPLAVLWLLMLIDFQQYVAQGEFLIW